MKTKIKVIPFFLTFSIFVSFGSVAASESHVVASCRGTRSESKVRVTIAEVQAPGSKRIVKSANILYGADHFIIKGLVESAAGPDNFGAQWEGEREFELLAPTLLSFADRRETDSRLRVRLPDESLISMSLLCKSLP